MDKKAITLAEIVDGQEEEDAVLEVLRSRWHTEGKYTIKLEEELCKLYDMPYCIMTNSGTSANFLALLSMGLKPGSIVLSSACGFNATLSPIVQLGFTPYLVDFNLNDFNINLYEIEQALKFGIKIDAMLIAHNLGISLDIDFLESLKNKYNFLLINDCCEGTGAKYKGKTVGSFGDATSLSFFPSHLLSSMGNGGCVFVKDEKINKKIRSLKSWGKLNIRIGEYCTKFTTTVDGIPYDEGYSYPELAYNLRTTDVQSAYLLQQLNRLPGFIKRRKENYEYLYNSMSDLPIYRMNWIADSEPSFFAFPICIKQEGLREKCVNYLEENGIKTRTFFGGNLLRQFAYKDLKWLPGNRQFPVADKLMRDAFFVGVHPSLTTSDMQYISDVAHKFFEINLDYNKEKDSVA